MTDKAAIRKILSRRATNALFSSGINTFDLIRQTYPEGLMRVPGLGMVSFREVEAAFFPGQHYIPVKKKFLGASEKEQRSEKLAEFLRTKLSSDYDDLK